MDDNNKDITSPNSSQSDSTVETLEPTSIPRISKRIFHVKDDTERKPGKFDWAERIWIPSVLGAISLLATVMGIWIGWKLTTIQESNAHNDRLIERARAASGDRQAVLTNYASRITDLISEKGVIKFDSTSPEKQATWDAIRGESIIALKRLDDSLKEGKGEIDRLVESMQNSDSKSRLNIFQLFSSGNANKSQVEELAAAEELIGFDDSGNLKGELVRFLYETKLLKGVNQEDPDASLLRGADLTRVNLSNAPLSDINLRRAWIPWGTLQNVILNNSDLRGTELRNANLKQANLEKANLAWANLQNATLEQANLSSANLESADLRGADLRGVILSATTFTDACYNASTTGLENFDIEGLGMIDASKEPLDKKCSALKPKLSKEK